MRGVNSLNAKISKKLQREFARCVREYGLINSGDRIIVGVSGGKDSLALLHLIKNFKRVVPFEFEFMAVTVDYQDGVDYSFLQTHCKEYDLPYLLKQTDIYKAAKTSIRKNSSFCSFFSRMRRGALYSVATELNFNKIALGHHLDDAVESFFMNMLYNGTLRTMPPIYNSKYNIEVIRPLIKVREEANRNFVQENGFRVIGDEMCPAMNFDAKLPYNRAKTKKLLYGLEQEYENLFKMVKSSFSHLHSHTFWGGK